MRLLLSISILLFSCSIRSYGQKADKKKTDKFLPVHIRYSDKVSYPPDSVIEFIKTYLTIKGVPVIDSSDVMELIRGEAERAWKANYKRGDPLPHPGETFKWMRVVAYDLIITVYRSLQDPVFTIDSVRWAAIRIPPDFEMRRKNNGLIHPAQDKKGNMFVILKETIDELVESVFHKED